MPTWRDLRIPLAVFVLALGARLLCLQQIRDIGFYRVPLSDARVYVERGRGIAAGDLSGPADFVHAPSYAYLVGMVFRIAGENLHTMRVVQSLVGATACALLVLTGRNWFGATIGALAGAGMALYPPAIFLDGLIQKTCLELLFATMVLHAMSRAKPAPIQAGISMGLLILTRQHALVLAPIVLAWICLRTMVSKVPDDAQFRGIPGIRDALAFVGAMVIILTPWVVRNRLVLGEFVLTTPNLGQNFHMGNCSKATGTYLPTRRGRAGGDTEQVEWVREAEAAAGRKLTATEVSNYFLSNARRWIAEHPLDWIRLTARKWMMTWNAYEAYDTEDYYLYQEHSWLLRWLDRVWHFGVLAPLMAAGAWLAVRTPQRRAAAGLLLIWIFVNALAITAFVVFARYRIIMLPAMFLLAACCSAVTLRQSRSSGRRQDGPTALQNSHPWIDLAIAGVLAIAAAVSANVTILSERRPQPTSYTNHASALAGQGRYDLALNESRRAMLLSPEDVEAQVAVADNLVELHQYREAAAHYMRAIDGDPRYERAHAGLGNALAGLERFADAEATYEKALAIEPTDRVARRGLGTVMVRTGRIDVGVAMLEKLVHEEPSYAEAWLNLGNARLMQNRLADAADCYRRALDGRADYVDAWYMLGQVEAARGDSAGSQRCLERALAIDPDRDDIRQALQRILHSQSREGRNP